MKTKSRMPVWLGAGIIVGMLIIPGCLNDPEESKNPVTLKISLRFKGPVYQGNYYQAPTPLPATDHAIWIEKKNGDFVRTLSVNPTIVKIGSRDPHPDHVPVWAEKSGETVASLKAQTDSGIPPAYDGITGASVRFGDALAESTLTAMWDFTDIAGNTVPADTYYFCAEVSNIKKDSGDGGYSAYTVLNDTTKGFVVTGSNVTVSSAQPTDNILSLSATAE